MYSEWREKVGSHARTPSLLEYIPSLPYLPAHFLLSYISSLLFPTPLILTSSSVTSPTSATVHPLLPLHLLTMSTRTPLKSKLVKRPASNLPAVDLSSDDPGIPAPSIKKSRLAPATRSGSLAASSRMNDAVSSAGAGRRQKTISVSSIPSVEVPYR
jgi:hypothetical protein